MIGPLKRKLYSLQEVRALQEIKKGSNNSVNP